jgi:hypothetical protein
LFKATKLEGYKMEKKNSYQAFMEEAPEAAYRRY